MDFAIHGITQTEMEPRGKCRVFKAANIYNTDVDGWAMDGGTEGVAQTKPPPPPPPPPTPTPPPVKAVPETTHRLSSCVIAACVCRAVRPPDVRSVSWSDPGHVTPTCQPNQKIQSSVVLSV
ncbi:hypothetical protein C0Q70_19730 [Pomacea canaliculata]|uniref:Uncharacterized protein n=1 Tax=Pomacea canaliculata TaxID=400727 RepID=A0A2T7NDJ2_POMCA|nr:hypothetical protein C0Q70_19730 [Pomacea canaliculata]